MGLHGVCWGVLLSFSTVQHPEIEEGSAAGQSQMEYSRILDMFESTKSLAVKGNFKWRCPGDGVGPCSLALQMQWAYQKKQQNRGIAVSQGWGWLVYNTAN